ncbi:MAG: NAD(P)-dependent alcohol dehydrogenase [Acidobacteriota bacterium]
MKAHVLPRFGLDHLQIATRPDPEPGPGQVQLRLRAASLNYRDLLMVEGAYDPRQPLPLIPGSDGVGVVEAVGPPDAGDGPQPPLPIGARVMTLFAQGWRAGAPHYATARRTLGGPLDGTLAERIVLDADGVLPVPAHLSDAEAATLTCAGVTAWTALVTHGGVRAGDTVLVLGTGGVAIFALQFARLLGARAIVITSSPAKCRRAEALGAWRTVDRTVHPDWGDRVRRMTDGGVDAVVELGGAGTLPQSLRAVRMGGTISLIGVLAGRLGDLDLAPIFMKQVRLQGVLVGSRADARAMLRAIDAHRLRPVVDRVYPFADAARALGDLRQGHHIGKLAIDLASA